MRKYLIICVFCFSILNIYSCASSKTNNSQMTVAEKKKQKDDKTAKEAALQKRGPVKEATKKPTEPDNRTKTIPIPLENK